MHGKHLKNKQTTFCSFLKFCLNRVSIPKYRVNANAYQFRPPKRAHLSDLSTDSVALANVIIRTKNFFFFCLIK
jgi:hypothetical protein